MLASIVTPRSFDRCSTEISGVSGICPCILLKFIFVLFTWFYGQVIMKTVLERFVDDNISE